MTLAVLTEKPSAGRAFAAALGGMQGAYNGENYVIVSARGHLYELARPDDQIIGADDDVKAKIKSWNLANLPWDASQFSWRRVQIPGTGDTLKQLKAVLPRVDEIVIATDLDPTGEGDSIAWNIIDELGLHQKKFSRMEFTDEAPASLQKAFVKRRPVKSMMDEGDYRKARFRDCFDFLTMQFTRVATLSAGQRAVLRQGRLKSAMIKLVGDQLAAHENYVKIPEFQNRFRDENGVLYTNPEEPRFKTAAQVPQIYQRSKVIPDKAEMKATGPRRLLDLAGLSARLSSKGVKADQVLATYQKMYEDQVVSYPRTEDKTITPEQFNELLPFANKIAAVVGVDVALLTHRQPRSSHVKAAGAHGANRPGPKVPASLDAVKTKYGPVGALIYEELSRSYLAMLADDYRYEAQTGHIEAYPAFVGRAAVPKSLGWKQVFLVDEDDDKDDKKAGEENEENAKGLGTVGEPTVYEIIPPRPERPTMKWLMKQLEKHDVGTGATRTSTYADVTKAKTDYPLLQENRGKITMTEFGDMSYRLLPGTRIGDIKLTEWVYGAMRSIADGKTTADVALAYVANWVREDIKTMAANAAAMKKELGLTDTQQQRKEKHKGVWAENGETIEFNKEWSGHTFTDMELEDLLAGKVIEFAAVSARTKSEFQAKGKLEPQQYNGTAFVGFKPDFGPAKDANGKELPPKAWCKHVFTPDETKRLAAGEKIYVDDFVSKGGKTFAATVHFGLEDPKKPKAGKKIIPEFG